MNKYEKTKKEAESNPVLIIIDIVADFYSFIIHSILCEFTGHILLKRVEYNSVSYSNFKRPIAVLGTLLHFQSLLNLFLIQI